MYGELFRTRYNVMDVSSLRAFADIRGGLNGNCKDVYFVRMVGRDRTYTEDVEQMDRLLQERMSQGQLRYNRIEGLPRLVSMEDANFYSGCYDNWVNRGRKNLDIRTTEGNEELKAAAGNACAEVVRLFEKLTPHANASIEKNFAVKLLFWMDQTGKELLQDWNPGLPIKFAASNLSKKQDYLFAYLLTLLGIDVLLLQYRSDIDGQLEVMQLSKKVVLGDFGGSALPPLTSSGYKAQSPGYTQAGNVQSPEHTQAGNVQRQEGSCRVVITEHPRRRSQRPAAAERVQPSVRTSGQRPVQPGSSARGSARQEMEFEALAQLASSVVMISVHDGNGQVLGTGSGIMIGAAGYILTNHHVARRGRYYSVRIEDDDKVYQTDEMIKYNSVLDLAVIRIERRLNPLPIYQGGKKLVRGQKVVAIGSPLGLFNSVSDGIISGFRVIDNVDMIQFTAPTSHGSSGGAVLNMYGEVIGISTAGFDDGQNLNLAVGYECISQFIRGFT